MTTQQIASRLAELCRQGKFEDAQKELYAQDVVSIEPEATPAFEKETKGAQKNLEKVRKFDSMVEKMHSVKVSEPIISGNSFAFKMDMDLTMKGRDRETMGELCVYNTKDGKIIAEQFFM
ncbi:MAG: nuclear transport factor 2 family protein [Agriterribacter sp.]